MKILLDDVALKTASEKMTTIASGMKTLREDMETELKNLKGGFETEAGDRFFKACDENLIKYMEIQERIIQRISTNLDNAKRTYSPIFEEYKALNDKIKKTF